MAQNKVSADLAKVREQPLGNRWIPGGNPAIETSDAFIVRKVNAEMEEAERLGPIKQICGPLRYLGEYHLLGGDDKAGKSKFSWNMIRAAATGASMIPHLPNQAGPLRCGIWDYELSPPAFKDRYEKHIKEQNLDIYIARHNFRSARWASFKGIERAKAITDEIGNVVFKFGLQCICIDNPMAALSDVSKTDEFRMFYEGMMAIRQEIMEAGDFFSYDLPMHLIKEAQGRRRRQKDEEDAFSQKTDIRGSGGVASLAGSVCEIRPSQFDPSIHLLEVYDTRHGDVEIDKDKQAYAFRVSHAPGDWSYEYIGIEAKADHFGKGRKGPDPTATDNYLHTRIKALHGQGRTQREIYQAFKDETPDNQKCPVSVKSIGKYLRGWGLEPNGKQFGHGGH